MADEKADTSESGGWSESNRIREKELFAQAQILKDAPESEQTDVHRRRVRDELVELHIPLVHHLVRRYRDRGEPLDDLIQVGMIGLINAVDRFDPSRGLSFSTFAVPTILGEIKRHFRDYAWTIKVPRGLQEHHLAVNKATDELNITLGRSPTVAEIARHIDSTESQVLEAIEAGQAFSARSIDAQLESDESGSNPFNRMGTEDPNIAAFELSESFRPALAGLTEKEREILRLRFAEELSQRQIAEKLGINQMQVSRILASSLAQVREEMQATA